MRTKEKFYCLVVGSRSFNDLAFMRKKLDKLLANKKDKEIVIVSGGAKGADQYAEGYAYSHDYWLKVFKADWDKYGKSAGYIRNEEMHKYISQFDDRGVVAFWDGESKGTAHNFELAKKYNNPIRVIRFSKEE